MNTKVHQICILDDYTDFIPPKTTYSVKNNIPGEYILWKENDIIKLIYENFDKKVIEAYLSIKPKALKADLARYCILYIYGGWYFDLLMTVDGTIANYNLNDFDMLVFRDIPLCERSVLPISNSIIWTKNKHNAIFKKTIEVVVENILNKIYPRTSHRISGPYVFGKVIAESCIENPESNILVGDLSFENNTGQGEFSIPNWTDKKRVHFAWHRLPGTQNSLPENYEKNSHYNDMYYQKELYKDI